MMPRSVLPLPRLALAVAGLAGLASTAPVAAQEAAPGRVTLRGTVVDAGTGLPLRDAVVRLGHTGRAAATDAGGAFVLHRVPAGEYPLVVERLGYRTRTFALEARSDTLTGQIALEPNPILLTAVQATVSRLDRRVHRYAGAVRVLSREQILATPASSARRVVLNRGGLRAAGLCRPLITTLYGGGAPDEAPSRTNPFALPAEPYPGGCYGVRGSSVRPGVYLDDLPLPGGVDDLDLYRADEIARIELYSGGRHIRLYTTAFMERAAHSGYRPGPILD